MDATVGDLDGDGALDLYFGRAAWGGCYEGPCYAVTSDELWLNDGRGCFASASASLPSFRGVALGVELGDIELDGDLDIVTSAPHVVLNHGGRSFTALALPHGIYGEDLALGDLDGDLLPDIYLAKRGVPGLDGILWNLAGRAFSAAQPAPGCGLEVALADLDGDADLDVVETAILTTYRNGPIENFLHVLRNEGGGAFTRVAVPRAASIGVAVGDLDQDGDTDVFDGSRVFHNLSRSLFHRGAPRIGHPAVLELHGPPAAGWVLLATTSLAPQNTPFGRRWIAPGPPMFRGTGTLDASGEARMSFAVPADRALIGAHLHWQALIGMPLRWSNFETTTLSSF